MPGLSRARTHPTRLPLIPAVRTINPASEEEAEVFNVQKDGGHLYHTVVFQSGAKKNFIVDTGSPITFLPLRDLQPLGIKKSAIQPSSTKIKGVSGHNLPVLGEVQQLARSVPGAQVPLNLIITKQGPAVLGLDGLRSLQVQVALKTSGEAASDPLPTTVQELITRCSNHEGGMRIAPIHLETSGQPVFMKNRQVPFGLRVPVKECLDEMVRSGVLQPVQSSPWATPIVTVLKPNGQPRICGDYRLSVNPLLHQTSATTMDIESMFEGLHGKRFFSKIDLTNAFLQIPLDESSSQLTTINTMWGLFRYNYLPFGLHVSPGIFQAAINSVIANVPEARAYQDDIIVSGTTRAEHDKNLLNLLKALDHHRVRINAKKSVFAVQSLKYLGHVLSGDGISADAERIQALRGAKPPNDAKELRSFLGFAQYLSLIHI